MIQPVIFGGGSGPRALRLPGFAGPRANAVLLQPLERGTAPALTLAAVHALSADDPVLLAMPSDPCIAQGEAFQRAVQRAAALAAGARIVAFGLPPSAAETGYGFIRADGDYVDAFVEKPAEAGQYLRNAGIYAVRASVWIDAIGAFRPDILKACERAWREARREGALLRVADRFGQCPSDSIECAVMQRVGQGGPEARVIRLEDDVARFEDSYDRTAAAAATR